METSQIYLYIFEPESDPKFANRQCQQLWNNLSIKCNGSDGLLWACIYNLTSLQRGCRSNISNEVFRAGLRLGFCLSGSIFGASLVLVRLRSHQIRRYGKNANHPIHLNGGSTACLRPFFSAAVPHWTAAGKLSWSQLLENHNPKSSCSGQSRRSAIRPA